MLQILRIALEPARRPLDEIREALDPKPPGGQRIGVWRKRALDKGAILLIGPGQLGLGGRIETRDDVVGFRG